MEFLLSFLVISGLLGGSGILTIRNLYYVCQPNEVLIFAGSGRSADGRALGYRIVKGGSSIRVPLLERVLRMDLTNMIIELKVTNAYSKGGIPLSVSGVANIKIAGQEPTIHNAIERLLGKSRDQIEAIAKETLEGNLRGVLASLTPEQVNEDKIAFAKSLLDEAEEDLQRLGLVLDTLQIQNISDNVSYLDSIGRRQQAQLQRDSRVAEAKARAESKTRSAENEQITALRRIDRDIAIAEAEADRQIQDAITRRKAVIAEAEANIGALVARTEADVLVQRERIKQVEQQLQADVIAPAEASCKRISAEAKGQAARIIEDGKAQAMGLKRLAESWRQAGSNAREIFLYQKLDVLLKTIASTVPDVGVQNVTVINSDEGNTAVKVAAFFEQLRQASGIDVAETVRGLTQPKASNSVASDLSQPLDVSPPRPSSIRSLDPPFETLTPLESRQLPYIDPKIRAKVKSILDAAANDSLFSTDAEQVIEQAIKYNPDLREQLLSVWQQGGGEALAHLFEHPQVTISIQRLTPLLYGL